MQVSEASGGSNPRVNWFGLLFSYADTKKKSSLMLALLEPGDCPVPWMDNLRSLGPVDELTATSSESSSHFPVKASSHRPSYSSSPVVWIKHASLHSDIQVFEMYRSEGMAGWGGLNFENKSTDHHPII